MNYAAVVLSIVNAPGSRFDSSVNIYRLADLKLNELYKAALAEVCALRVLLF